MNSCIEATNSYFHETLKKRVATMSNLPTLEEAAQTFVEGLYADFGTAVLVRLYTTMPYANLSPATKTFADSIAKSAAVYDQVGPDTQVLCLMGTQGKRPAWCDPGRCRKAIWRYRWCRPSSFRRSR
jgi:hypothetical protein